MSIDPIRPGHRFAATASSHDPMRSGGVPHLRAFAAMRSIDIWRIDDRHFVERRDGLNTPGTFIQVGAVTPPAGMTPGSRHLIAART